MWKNILELDRPQMTIWCMRTACWIPKAKIIDWGYVMLIAVPSQQWLNDRAWMLPFSTLPVFFFISIFIVHTYFSSSSRFGTILFLVALWTWLAIWVRVRRLAGLYSRRKTLLAIVPRKIRHCRKIWKTDHRKKRGKKSRLKQLP